MERTLILVKPDAVQRGLVGQVITRLEQKGFKITGMKLLHMDKSLAERHYSVHKGKPFYEGLVKYITSSPVVAMVLEGRNAVVAARKTMGSTDSSAAEAGTIRGDLGLDIERNLVHGSDSVSRAEEEIALFFAEKELVRYSRDTDRWITEF